MLKWFRNFKSVRDSAMLVGLPLLAGMVVLGLGTQSPIQIVSAGLHLPTHVIPSGGVQVNCESGRVSVTVQSWEGNVEIVKHPGGKTTEGAPVPPVNGVATFSIATIGGNGSYTAGRQGFPNDPTPVAFTVDCSQPKPSPSPKPSPKPTPTPKHSPLPPNGGAYWGG